jgi:hypothetical protein
MRGTADMLRTFRKRRLGTLFSIVAGLMVSLTVAPARAADLALPTDEKILQALKAKRLTRCPHAGTRLRCGGARLPNLLPKGRAAMFKSPSMTAAPRFRARAISFAARLGNQVFDPAVGTAAPVCSGAGPEAWRGAVVLEDGGIAGLGGCRLHPSACWRGSTAAASRDSSWGLGGRGLLGVADTVDPRHRARQDQVPALRPDVRGDCVLRYANGRFSANLT